jgi:competence protein ComGC
MDKPDKDEKAKKKKFAFGWIELFIVAVISLFFASISTPKFRSARERANTRACYANQKTVVGAIEMYNLDRKPEKATKNPIETTDDLHKHYQTLKSGGYLQSIPDDPGFGKGSSGNYLLTNSGNGITCKTHGSIQ